MRRTSPLIFLLLLSFSAAAQTRNGAYLELGGSGIVPTINYERRVNERWYGRAGVSWVTSETSDAYGNRTNRLTTWIVPLTASAVSRPAGNHHFELGGGLTLAAGDRQDLYGGGATGETFSSVYVTGLIGYRYQKPRGGFQFRAAFTPAVGGGDFVPSAGVSFGYAW